LGGKLLLGVALFLVLFGFGFFAAVGAGQGGKLEGAEVPVVEVSGAEMEMDDGAGPGRQDFEALFFSAGAG
jgi:hypothetical protein